jgi:hypothetical protein
MAPELLSERLPLHADGIMPMLPAPDHDPLNGTAEAILRCFALHDPLAGARHAPVVGEAQ